MRTAEEIRKGLDRCTESINGALKSGMKVTIDTIVIERVLLEIALQLAIANEEKRDERIREMAVR